MIFIVKHPVGFRDGWSVPIRIEDESVFFRYTQKDVRISLQHARYIASLCGMSEDELYALAKDEPFFGYIRHNEKAEFEEVERLYWRYGFSKE